MDKQAAQLIDKHLDGCASSAELAELDRLLVQSPAVADALWNTAQVHAILTLYWQGNIAGDGWAVQGSVAHQPARRALPRLLFAATAAVLVLVAVLGVLQWDRPDGHRVLAGTVEVAGVPVDSIADNDALRVVGEQTAVIRLAGGSKAHLGPSTLAVVRGRDRSGTQVIELLEGGGRFCVPRAAPTLCVQTAAGAVTAATTDFQVNLWPTEGKGDDEMQFRSLLVLAVAVSAGMVEVNSPEEHCVVVAGSQAVFGAETPATGKTRDLATWLPPGDVLGFTQKGAPFALERVFPGLTAALRLTDEQKQKLAAAIDQTIGRQEVRAAMALTKLDPKATEAQKQEARKVVEQARAELKKQVAQILTGEQKAQIEKINAAVAEVQTEVRQAMHEKFQALKTDPTDKDKVQQEYQQRVREAIEARLMKLLDPEAAAAVKKAAAQAGQIAEKPPKGVKAKGDKTKADKKK